MALNPDTYDQLTAAFRKFDNYPEAGHTGRGVVMKTGAFTAFLEARQLIDKLRQEVFAELKGWQDIATYFEAEPETSEVLLWAPHPDSGEHAVLLGYWDDDERAWYRAGRGPDLESAPLAPTKWMPLGELMRAAEFVAIPRMD